MTGWGKYVNSYRISENYANDNFGLVHINWEAEPSPLISLKAIDLQGSVVIEHKISLDELQAEKIVDKILSRYGRNNDLKSVHRIIDLYAQSKKMEAIKHILMAVPPVQIKT